MKKFASILLVLSMVMSMGTTAFAANDYETLVTYTGDGTSSYTVTVPSELAPGASGTVKVSGAWASNMTVKVTAPDTVTLTNDIDGGTKTLDVDFDGISQVGDNTNSISVSETISVEEITNALFGTWTGTIVYTVSATTDETTGSGSSGSTDTGNEFDREYYSAGDTTTDKTVCENCGLELEAGVEVPESCEICGEENTYPIS